VSLWDAKALAMVRVSFAFVRLAIPGASGGDILEKKKPKDLRKGRWCPG